MGRLARTGSITALDFVDAGCEMCDECGGEMRSDRLVEKGEGMDEPEGGPALEGVEGGVTGGEVG